MTKKTILFFLIVLAASLFLFASSQQPPPCEEELKDLKYQLNNMGKAYIQQEELIRLQQVLIKAQEGQIKSLSGIKNI